MKPRTLLAVCAVALLSATSALADEWNHKTIVTFSQPVAIPAVHQPGWGVLAPGTYVFKLLDSSSDRHIVQIYNKDENEIYATILAIPNMRLRVTDKPVITFRETAAGEPAAIRAMFYPGANWGEEFVYPKTKGKGALHAQYQAQSMAYFASSLGRDLALALGRDPNAGQPRVVDKTGLTGRYDFTVEFDCQGCVGLSAAIRATLPLLAARGGGEPGAVGDAPDPGSGLPNIFTALEKQLGLRLMKVKDVPVDVVVFDHVEKTPLPD